MGANGKTTPSAEDTFLGIPVVTFEGASGTHGATRAEVWMAQAQHVEGAPAAFGATASVCLAKEAIRDSGNLEPQNKLKPLSSPFATARSAQGKPCLLPVLWPWDENNPALLARFLQEKHHVMEEGTRNLHSSWSF